MVAQSEIICFIFIPHFVTAGDGGHSIDPVAMMMLPCSSFILLPASFLVPNKMSLLQRRIIMTQKYENMLFVNYKVCFQKIMHSYAVKCFHFVVIAGMCNVLVYTSWHMFQGGVFCRAFWVYCLYCAALRD